MRETRKTEHDRPVARLRRLQPQTINFNRGHDFEIFVPVVLLMDSDAYQRYRCLPTGVLWVDSEIGSFSEARM